MKPIIDLEKAKSLTKDLKEKTQKISEEKGAQIKQFAEKAGKQAQDIGEQALSVAQDVGQTTIEGIQTSAIELKKKMLNPVFEYDLKNPEFKLPHLIHIVESDKRQNDPLCEGSIGWIDRKKEVNVLHLYYASLASSGLSFSPSINCDALYYVDLNQPKEFVLLSSYFDEMQNSKFAELEQVAYKLGAKRYYIEVMEESKESHSSKKEGTLKSALKIPFSANKSTEITDKGYKRSQYAAEAEFENSGEPVRPTLTWFNNDKQLNSLIEMRCSNDEAYRLSTRKLTFDYQSTSAITLETATKIDAAIKDMGFKSNVKREVEEQKRKKLVFNIEF